jgi:hypothetical protein
MERRGGAGEGGERAVSEVGETILSVEAWVIMSNTKEKAEGISGLSISYKRHKKIIIIISTFVQF